MASLYKLPTGNTKSGHAEPNQNGGVVDVVSEYPWTVNDPANAARETVPYIEMTEYQITSGQLQTSLYYWVRGIRDGVEEIGSYLEGGFDEQGGSVTNNPYDGLYRADPTGFTYRLPFFGNYNHNIDNMWSDENSMGRAISNLQHIIGYGIGVSIFDTAKKAAAIGSGIAGVVGSLFPNTGAESPKSWNGGTDASYQVSFDLLNTLRPEDITRNWELCFLLGYQSMHWRRNLLLSYPPCIYEITIPGVRYCPAATISNLVIEDLGHKRIYNGRSYPDAYRVTIAITELVTESRNIYKGIDDGNKITAIRSTGSLASDVKGELQGILQVGKQAISNSVESTILNQPGGGGAST